MKRLTHLYASRWSRYAVSVLLLSLVAWKVHPERLLEAAGSTRPQYLALAVVLTVPFLCLKALRWHLMLQAASVQASFAEAFLSLVGGMGLALITPARLGEVVRAAYLRDAQKLKIAGLVMVDKGFDVLVLALLSIAGAWVLLGPLFGLALVLLSALGLLMIYRARDLHEGVRHAARRIPGRTKIERTLSSLEALTPVTSTIFLVLTALSFGVVLIQFGVILLSWRDWSLDVVFLTFPLVVLTNVVPITVAGLGVREGAAVVLLAHYGVSAPHAVLAALLMFAINTALPGILGALLLPAAPAPRSTPKLERL